MNDRITVYICRECGKVAIVYAQPALLIGRPGCMCVECHTHGCNNWMTTKCTKDQIAQWYTAVSVDVELAARMIEVFETVG